MDTKKKYSLGLPVFLAGVLISIGIFFYLQNERNKVNNSHFQNLINRTKAVIAERVTLYENALRSGASLYYASKSVERDEWKAYVNSFTIVERHPGILGMGVITPVKSDNVESFLTAVRADGVPEFAIRDLSIPNNSSPTSDEKYIITFIEPAGPNQTALGLNIGSEKNRLEAALQARNTGNAIMTRQVQLVQDNVNRPGFLLLFPVYKKGMPTETVADRQLALDFLIYAPAITEQFFDAAFKDKVSELDVDIFDSAQNTSESMRIYTTRNNQPITADNYVTDIMMAGKEFTFSFQRSAHFVEADTANAYGAFIFSLIISVVMSILMHNLENTKTKAEQIAIRMTKELQENEQRLLKSHKDLEIQMRETLIASENLKTAQAQLLQSQKLESIGKLAGGIAHDFNNILGGIMGYASLLQEELADNPKSLKRVETIMKASEKGAQLTKELLGFARKGEYERKVINLNDCISETLSLLEGTIEKTITIEKNLNPKLNSIEADPTQINQIIMNLGINARDAMGGVGSIHVATQNKTFNTSEAALLKLTPGNYVELTFKDSGTGIPDDIRDKIFDPFFTTKGPGKGTGLGLSMIYGIVQNQQGAILLEPYTKGVGAVFRLYFMASSHKEMPLKNESAKQDNISTETLKNINILVVDDEAPIRNFAKEIFLNTEAHVTEAENGVEALEKIKSGKKFDIILLDIIMPKMSGIEAFYEMKNLKTKAAIIFSTGYTEGPELLKIRANHEVWLIKKPFKKDELLKTVAEVLKQKK